MPSAIEFLEVRKSHPVGFLHLSRRFALQGLTLRVQSGETFGLLGPNGAGKTTAFSLIFGFTHADSGSVRVLGSSPHSLEWKTHAAYLPEQPFLHEFLTPLESLKNAGRLLGLPGDVASRRARHWLERMDIESSAHRVVRYLSKGMRQRLAVALCLVGEPQLLVLDEPMSGLDPIGRALIRDLVQELRNGGRTILFSTHVLQDAEALCDRVGLIANGRLLAEGSLDDLLGARAEQFEITLAGPPAVFLDAPDATPLQGSGYYRAVVHRKDLGRSIADFEAKGGSVVSVQAQRESLDQLFARKLSTSKPLSGGDASS